MFSIQKFLVLIGFLWIVWTLFKLFDNRGKNLKSNNDNVKCAECGEWIKGQKCENLNCSRN